MEIDMEMDLAQNIAAPVNGVISARMYDPQYMAATHDIILKLNDKEELQCHRSVIGAVSLPLRNLVYPLPTVGVPVIPGDLPAINAPISVLSVAVPFSKAQFKAILDYVYLGTTGKWDIEQAKAVRFAADYYGINGLVILAEQEMVKSPALSEMTHEKVYDLYRYALAIKSIYIQRGIATMIRRSFRLFFERKDEFLFMPYELLSTIFDASSVPIPEGDLLR